MNRRQLIQALLALLGTRLGLSGCARGTPVTVGIHPWPGYEPLLLARGVAVPMPVILIGALGGMVTNGIIGLFIGPVLLAVGYQLFWQWVDDQPEATAPAADDQQPT